MKKKTPWQTPYYVSCGSTEDLTKDHVLPRWFSQGVKYFGFRMRRSNMGLGPPKETGLYQTLCRKCNSLKSGIIDFSNPMIRAYVKQFVENVQEIIKIHE